MLQTPEGIESIATVTELRSNTAEVVASPPVLIVKNNDPYAVVLSVEKYRSLTGGGTAAGNDQDRASTNQPRQGHGSY